MIAVSNVEIRPGQIWRCDEGRADPARVPDSHDVDLWEPHPRFVAVVDEIRDGVVTLTASYGNSHPRTPDFGAKLDLAAEKLLEGDRWTLRDGDSA